MSTWIYDIYIFFFLYIFLLLQFFFFFSINVLLIINNDTITDVANCTVHEKTVFKNVVRCVLLRKTSHRSRNSSIDIILCFTHIIILQHSLIWSAFNIERADRNRIICIIQSFNASIHPRWLAFSVISYTTYIIILYYLPSTMVDSYRQFWKNALKMSFHLGCTIKIIRKS